MTSASLPKSDSSLFYALILYGVKDYFIPNEINVYNECIMKLIYKFICLSSYIRFNYFSAFTNLRLIFITLIKMFVTYFIGFFKIEI